MPTTDKPPLPPIPDGWLQLEPREPRRPGDAFKSFDQWVIFNPGQEDMLVDDWPCIRRIEPEAEVERMKAEVERFKRGDLTEDELNEFCHNLSPDHMEPFCDGCDEYQRKLFGTCRTDQLRGQQWIPCSERMPTAEDGDVEGMVLRAWQVASGKWRTDLCHWDTWVSNPTAHWRRTGIDSLPDRTAEPEKPKRREWYQQDDSGELILTLESRPGDPDIDVCCQFLDMLESRCGDGELTTVPFPARELREWVQKCRGVNNA